MKQQKALDAKDIQMLNELHKDASITNLKLASKVKLSPGPTLRRHGKLEKAGYIMGYHAKIDYTKLGYAFTAMVIATVHERSYEQFCETLNGFSSVKNVYVIPADKFNNKARILALAVCKSEEDFVTRFGQLFASLPYDVLFSTYHISEIVKDDLSVPVEI